MQLFFAAPLLATAVALNLARKDNSTEGQYPPPATTAAPAGQFPAPAAPAAPAGQFPPPAAPAAAAPAAAAPAPAGGPGMCPGTGASRVWYMCVGAEFDTVTATEYAEGIEVGNKMSCTPEYDFECLCCLNFKLLAFSRSGDMTLDAANEPAGSPISLADDAQMPGMPAVAAPAPAGPKPQIVTLCTKDAPVGEIAGQQQGDGAPVMLPVNCVAREFTVDEITGNTMDAQTGMPLAAGQTVLDERIAFLVAQGIPAADIPTCKATIATCPVGSPKAGEPPNSAGQDALNSIGVAAFVGESVEQEAVQLLEEEQALEKQKGVKRSRGRTFEDLAKMTAADVEKILGDKRMLAFVKDDGSKVAFRVDKVTSRAGGLTLAGEGKTLEVLGRSVEFSDGGSKAQVAPSTVVLTLARSSLPADRTALLKRGSRSFAGALMTSGSFTMMAASGVN